MRAIVSDGLVMSQRTSFTGGCCHGVYTECMKSLRAGTYFGVPIIFTPGSFLLFGGIAALLATQVYPDLFEQGSTTTHIVMAVVSAFLFFLTIALHELGHCLVARAYRVPVKSITFYFMGGVSQITRDAKTPLEELLIAIVGPATNIAIALALLGGWQVFLGTTETAVGMVVLWLATMNGVIAVLNLVPALPLDGGRIFRSLAWMVTKNPSLSTRSTAWLTRGLAWAMMAAGILAIFRVNVFLANDLTGGAWLLFVGFFLGNAATQALFRDRLSTELDRYSAGELMMNPPVVQSSASVGSLARGVLEINPRVCYFVEDDGRLAGILGAPQMRLVPLGAWDTTSAGDAMVPRARLQATAPDRGLAQVLLEMETDDLTYMPVVDQGRVVGVIGRDRILGVLQKAGLLGKR